MDRQISAKNKRAKKSKQEIRRIVTVGYAQLMSRYNRWMHDKIYAAGEQCSDAQRKADLGGFFKSAFVAFFACTHGVCQNGALSHV